MPRPETGQELDGIARSKRHLAARKGWARRRRDWAGLLDFHSSHEAFTVLCGIVPDLQGEPPEVYWRLVGATWVRDEMPSGHAAAWRHLWSDPRHGREASMSAAEQHILDELPRVSTVYRGVGDARHVNGLSWTLDREKAEWFARRGALISGGDARPLVAVGAVLHDDIAACFGSREESELVALKVEVSDVHDVEES